MDEPQWNISTNATEETCEESLTIFMQVNDILTFLVGQPLTFTLLRISLKSTKTLDILNINLALFHNVQYIVTILHFFTLTFKLKFHSEVTEFLFVYTQIGGPMSRSFICLQRYVAVVHPTSYPLLKKYRFREVSAALMWFLSITLGMLYAFSDTQNSIESMREEIISAFPFTILLSMTLMIVQSSIFIMKTLKKSVTGREKLHPAKKKAYYAMLAMSAIAVFFYIPVALMQRILDPNSHNYECFVIPACICLLSCPSVIHPLYCLYTQRKLLNWSKLRKVLSK